jgi:hypothetical protein
MASGAGGRSSWARCGNSAPAAARQALEALKLKINLDLSEKARAPRTFADLVEHYKAKEMAEESEDHSFSTSSGRTARHLSRGRQNPRFATS